MSQSTPSFELAPTERDGSRLDPFGLRYWLPESLNAPLRRVLRRTAQPDVDRSEFGVERVRHDRESAETGLDLLAYVRR